MFQDGKINYDEKIFIILSLLTFLPLSGKFNLIRILIVGIAFIIKFYSNSWKVDGNIGRLGLKMLISPFLPVLMVIILDKEPISLSLVEHEVMRLVFAVMVIWVAYELKVSFDCVYKTTVCIFVVNFLIQICQYNGVEFVYNFIKNNYVLSNVNEWSHLELSLITDESFRAGSIYINPNVYMVIPLVALAVFFQKKIIKDSFFNNLLIISCVISCILTGSRTSVVVSMVIILYYYFKYDSNVIKTVSAILVAAILLVLMINSDILDLRAFKLDAENLDSLTVKIKGFGWYWTSANPLYWIFGSLGSSTVSGIDCELGHIYTWFGLFGMYWYIQYYSLIRRRNEQLVFFSKIIVLTMVLTAMTASVLLAMQVSTFVCMLAFSKIYSKDSVKTDMCDNLVESEK